MDFTRFEQLLQVWQDGGASAAELQEFETLLKSDPLYRKELVQSVLIESGLHRRYAAARAADVAAAAPPPRAARRRWEAAAAMIVLAVSLFAVGRLLIRTESPAHRVLSGEVWTLGAPANVLREGQTFEVRGLAPATVQLKDGTQIVLDAGSAGSLPPEGFELAKGSASFIAGPALRVTTPAGSLRAAHSQFWILLRPSTRKLPKELARRPELVVETARGSVEVDAWDTRVSIGAGQRRIFGAPLPAGGTDYARLLGRSRLTLSAAIALAASAAPGIPLHAELEEEDGRIAFSIGLAVDGKGHELLIDPQSGKVIEEEIENEDRSRVAAAVTLPLQALLDKVLESVPGRAVEAELELKGGRLRAEIKVLGPDGLREVQVDAATGALLEPETKGDRR